MTLMFEPLAWPDDAVAATTFLATHEWPFHGVPRLNTNQAAAVPVAGDEVAAFWIRADGETVGMIRVLDLDDLGDGSPLFDLRIAEGYRGRGVGRAAVNWLGDHLFTTYPELHRIEATTRHDNVAMQSVLAHCGYRLEGQLLETWKHTDGTWLDTLIFAFLRREWAARHSSGATAYQSRPQRSTSRVRAKVSAPNSAACS